MNELNELIKIEVHDISGAGVQTCNARNLWQFVESKQDFSTWIKSRIDKYGLVEGDDYLLHKFMEQVPHQGGVRSTTVIAYHLTLQTAKELAMVEKNNKGREVRRYFIECERRMKTRPASNPANLSRIQLLEIALQAEQERLALAHKVGELTPKAQALDRIATADGSVCPTDAAKNLNVQRKALLLWLQKHKWLYRRMGCSHYCGYQDKIQSGLIEQKVTVVKRQDGTEKIVEQARITANGLAKLAKVPNFMVAI